MDTQKTQNNQEVLRKKNGEREIKESIPFTIATKIIKYLGINLSKDRIHRKL